MNPASEEADSPPPRPFLVIVTGEPGSGKTTLGRELAPGLLTHQRSRALFEEILEAAV